MLSFHASLETLWLPADSAPIRTISQLDWPRLRELRLFGGRWTDPATPIISLFGHLSHLRLLVLELSEPQGVDARAVWPRGVAAVYPWPELRCLTLSHPSTDDSVYSHLPRTLERLALRQWEHGCMRAWLARRYDGSRLRPVFPLIEAEALACILHQVDAPELRGLEIEYRADDSEANLWREVVARFPHLVLLEIHRYHKTGTTTMHMVSESVYCNADGESCCLG